MAVRGDTTLGGGFSVGDKLDTAVRPPIDRPLRDSLVVGGSLSWGSGTPNRKKKKRAENKDEDAPKIGMGRK